MQHIFKKNLLSSIFCFLTTLLFAQQATTFPNEPIQVKHYTLKNGLQVYLSENHDQPKIFGMVAVKAGGKHDPADATGIAHYLEHMLFKGTDVLGTTNFKEEKIYLDSISQLYDELGKTTDTKLRQDIQKEINRISVIAAKYAIPNEMDRMLSEIGGNDINAFTTEEHTAYFNSFPSHEIEKWLDIYAHRFENPVFRLFQSELETVYEEKNRSNDNTFGMVFEEFMKNFYKKHPYGQQTILGTTEHLKNPSLKKMYEYYNTYYVANNMALFLSGDFNADEVIQYIEARFSNWRNAPIPSYPTYEEVPFKGKEKVSVKMTPVKAAILGFRTVPHNHKDNAPLEIMSNLLSNPEQSGFIDKLTADGKLLMAYVLPLIYNDHGGLIIAIVPKIIGQSINKAEALVWNEINKIKRGEFDESQLEAAKINMLKSQKTIWESNEKRVMSMLESFSQHISWGEYLQNLAAINDVKKEDVMRVANTYLGDNYLAFVSKMGFPKKEKLPKPGFIPVIPDKESFSEFYQKWKNKEYESQKRERKIQDYNIAVTSVKGRVTLKHTQNPFNNIFTTTIRYGIGYYDIPELKYAAQYLNMIGSNKMSNDELRKRMYTLGCSYSFSCTENEFIIYLEGLENNLEEALMLINQLIQQPKSEKLKDKKLVENIFAEHKIMSREPNYVSQGLQEYVLYGEKSIFLNTLDKKQIKALNGERLLAKAKEAFKYEVTIHYIGQRSVFDVKEVFAENVKFENNLLERKGTIVRDRIKYNNNQIFLVNKKEATQSQINFNIEGYILDLTKVPTIDAFNQYFGNDMSSLVFQEIREFRSLAYSAYGRYNIAPLKGKNNFFNAYIGCQADKTEDALDAMMNLILSMPEKPERMDGIKSALILSAQTTQPSFRNIISNVEQWYDKGYTENPLKTKVPAYKNLEFKDLVSFYKDNIKEKPVIITIVSDKKKLNLKTLEKFGKIQEIKEKDLFKLY